MAVFAALGLGGCQPVATPSLPRVSASTYFLAVQRPPGALPPGATGRGTAVAIARNEGRCTLLTAAHVVRGGTDILVTPWAQSSVPGGGKKGRVMASNEASDLAVVEAPLGDGCHPAPLGRAEPPIGTEISIFGHPADGAGLLTIGHVGAYWETSTPQGQLGVSDALVHPGTSGAGVFESDGSLVGIVIGRSAEERGPGVAEPSVTGGRPSHLSYFVLIERARVIAPEIFAVRTTKPRNPSADRVSQDGADAH